MDSFVAWFMARPEGLAERICARAGANVAARSSRNDATAFLDVRGGAFTLDACDDATLLLRGYAAPSDTVALADAMGKAITSPWNAEALAYKPLACRRFGNAESVSRLRRLFDECVL